ncbi:MAG TPA: alpha/beta hydrolase [Bacteroidales bacterium]|nr:alpha/beta hydrolase [Bacteroidales bacterium]
MRWTGMKRRTEKKMQFGLFVKHPAEPPKSLRKNFSVRVSELCGRKVWTVSPLQGNADLVMLYLHGGAYMANINRQHWDLIGQLILKTRAVLIVPDYPLAPEATYKEAYLFMDQLYESLLASYPASRMIFCGDSAGGGLALGFSQHLKNVNRKLSEQLILFSPWLDLRMSHPDLEDYAAADPILTIEGLKSAAEKYAGDTDLHDFRVSPICGTFDGLCRISVFTGTNDLLHADAKKLKQLLDQQNISFNYFEYPGMFHDWVIITSLKESQDVINKVKGLVR